MNIYELSHELALINDELEENGGELTTAIEQRILDSELPFKDKCRDIGLWRLNLDSQADALKREEDRLAARRKAVEGRSNRLKELVQAAMETAGIDKLDLDTIFFRLQNNPPSVEVWNEREVPAKYVTFKTETVIDKKAILADLKNGVEVAGVVLREGHKHLRQR